MDEQIIGNIVLTIAIGTPTAYWIGKFFYGWMSNTITFYAEKVGYSKGYVDGYEDATKETDDAS